MLVVISDLHFEEESSRNIPGDGEHQAVEVPRNISLKAFTKIFGRLDEQAQRDGAVKMDLVLAGDIFELHRTALWFQNNPHDVRPYVSAAEVEAPLEAKLLEILHAINEKYGEVWQILAAFRRLTRDGYYTTELGQERKFPVPVKIHYIPGNHDRLANSTPAIRRTIRKFLGLPSSIAPFQHALAFEEERALIRHGNEYDPLNFSEDYSKAQPFPSHLPRQAYDGATIGDFITVDVAARISTVFRKCHGDARILSDPMLRRVYTRALEFDDLRPMHALFNFLLYMSDSGFTPEQIWDGAIEPVVVTLLNDLHDHPFLTFWLDKLDRKGLPDLVDAVQAVLALQAWNWAGLSLKQVQLVSDLAINLYTESPGPEAIAAREETIQNEEHLFVVCGHTHIPAVKLIGVRAVGEQYYVDTGTWRRQIPAAPDFRSFGRIKSLTYVALYGPNEDPRAPTLQGKVASLDYWSGVTERWIK